MPKIIPNLSENILKECRNILLDPNRADLAIRDVAAACNVAVGTVYNYYPSKEYMMAAVMLADWKTKLEDICRGTENAGSLMEGIRVIYDGLTDYVELYRIVWQKNIASPGSQEQISLRHEKLLEDINTLLMPLLVRFNKTSEGIIPTLLSVIMIERAQTDTTFEEIAPAIEKLLA